MKSLAISLVLTLIATFSTSFGQTKIKISGIKKQNICHEDRYSGVN